MLEQTTFSQTQRATNHCTMRLTQCLTRMRIKTCEQEQSKKKSSRNQKPNQQSEQNIITDYKINRKRKERERARNNYQSINELPVLAALSGNHYFRRRN